MPDLPKANYSVWVRGYGLVDSAKVAGDARARQLNLTAVVAPTPRAAAQYYPAGYWFSLMQGAGQERVPGHRPVGQRHRAEHEEPGRVAADAEVGHVLGLSPARHARRRARFRRRFDDDVRRSDARGSGASQSGQAGAQHDAAASTSSAAQRALAMFADWTDRIAAGEVPPAPPRPQGLERNVVITQWDWADPKAYLHDEVSTDRRNPTRQRERPDLRRRSS